MTFEVLFFLFYFLLKEEYEFEKENELKRSLVSESDSDEYWDTKLPRDLEVIIKMFEIPKEIRTSKKKLFSFLHKGIFFDEDKKVASFKTLHFTYKAITFLAQYLIKFHMKFSF